MPDLGDFGRFDPNLASSALASSPLWRQDIKDISLTQLQAFKAAQRLQGNPDAQELYDRALALIELALNRPRAAPRVSSMSVDDFARGLALMPRAHADAIVFALEMGWSPERVVSLVWGDLADLALTPAAKAIVAQQPRHIVSGYVFWQDWGDGKAAPIFGIELRLYAAMSMNWWEVQAAWEAL